MAERPRNPAEAEEWLLELVRQLDGIVQEYQPGHPAISIMQWFIDGARERSLDPITLDRALGLVHGKAGKPAVADLPRYHPARRRLIEIALNAHPHVVKAAGKRLMWKPIASAIGFPGSANELRKIYGDHFDAKEYAVRELVGKVASRKANQQK